MTDQQTLLHRAYHHLHICTDGDRELADDIARALAAETTAPDRDSLRDALRLARDFIVDYDPMGEVTDMIDAALAAEPASFPPLDAERAGARYR